MKIACDTQISKSTVNRLLQNNFDVVFRANNEPDDVWVEKALGLGAWIFVSPDLDISLYLDKQGIDHIWIDVRQGLKKGKQFDYLVNKLRGIR